MTTCIHFGEVGRRVHPGPHSSLLCSTLPAMGKWLHIAASAVLAALWIAVFVLKTEIFALSSSLRAMKSIERVQIGVRFEMLPLLSSDVKLNSLAFTTFTSSLNARTFSQAFAKAVPILLLSLAASRSRAPLVGLGLVLSAVGDVVPIRYHFLHPVASSKHPSRWFTFNLPAQCVLAGSRVY
jgi:hypothetical protein